MTRVRPLRWHDIPLAYRLAGHGTSFDTQLITTVGDDILYHALLTGLRRTQMFVMRTPGVPTLGQLHYPPEQQSARLSYVAPALRHNGSEDAWLELFDGLSEMAGQRGIISLVAEVNEGLPEIEVLRRGQFGVYGRQSIWRRAPGPIGQEQAALRPARTADVMSMQGLYTTLIPGLLRQVEPSPMDTGDSYVLDGGNGGISGMVIGYRGLHASLIEIYLASSETTVMQPFLNAALANFDGAARPVYCRLRYVEWLVGAMDEVGFEHVWAQVVMVRHMAAHIRRPDFEAVSAGLEGKASLPTSIRIK